MRLVARVAGKSAGVICGYDLGEGFRLGAVGFMAAGANDGGVEFFGFYGSGIVRMPRLRAVAGFAGYDHVLAQFFLIYDVGVTTFANVMSGEVHGAPGGLGNGSAAIVPILPKAMGYDGRAQHKERHQQDDHHDRQPDEVFGVLEHGCCSLRLRCAVDLREKCAMSLDTGDFVAKR